MSTLEDIDFEWLIKELKPKKGHYKFILLNEIMTKNDIDVDYKEIIDVLRELGYKIDCSFTYEVPFFAKPLAIIIILLWIVSLFCVSFVINQ